MASPPFCATRSESRAGRCRLLLAGKVRPQRGGARLLPIEQLTPGSGDVRALQNQLRPQAAGIVLSLPDFIVNAGGVICAAVEYRGGSQVQAFATIEEKIRLTTQETRERARAGHLLPRAAAAEMVRGRITEAMRYRRR